MAVRIPRPEHPRPDFVRPRWGSLNGVWDFAFDPDDAGLKADWFQKGRLRGRITVPFPPESRLSGIGDTDFHPIVWYARNLSAPREWKGDRTLLHFGAVDYACRVWLDGEEVGSHRGGYTPFSVDISDRLKPSGGRLVLRVEDKARSLRQPSGKQCPDLESRGCYYTRTTGVWQSVWLEGVGRAYLERTTRLTPNLSARTLTVLPDVGGAGANGLALRVEVFDGRDRVAHEEGPAEDEVVVAIPKPKPWSPESPFLYTLRLTLRDGKRVVDRSRSYFGLRDIAVEGRRVLLNGRPIIQKLVLDQRFYPNGVYTAPSDRAIRNDIRLAMLAGFNGARIHQKVDDPRYHYWADRMGFLAWGEMADWGADLSLVGARGNLEREWIEAVRRDANHPCVIAWTPFNERRGPYCEDADQQAFVEHIYRRTREEDGTRPVVDNDGYCHGHTDLATIHDYAGPEELRERWERFGQSGRKRAFPKAVRHPSFLDGHAYSGQPVILSEIGGIWFAPESEREGWGYGGRPASAEEFVRRYSDTVGAVMEQPEIAGYCVTQLFDVEQEQNGVYYEDRSEKLPPAVFAAIHAGPKRWRRSPGAKELRSLLGR